MDSLGGWFDCPSKEIGDRLWRQGASVARLRDKARRDLEVLKNGEQASVWRSLKEEVSRLENEINQERKKLEKEKEIAISLGIQGLGAWCNEAVAHRKRAEVYLRKVENQLGELRGSFKTLERQQKEGIDKAETVINANKETIKSLKTQILFVKQQIKKYKAERDAAKIKQEAARDEGIAKQIEAKAKNMFSKENMALTIGVSGLIVFGLWVSYNKKKKE